MHRNLMPFYGICLEDSQLQYALVSPWMKNGDLLNYLKANPTKDRCSIVRRAKLMIASITSDCS